MEEPEEARPDAEALPALLANRREFLSFLERRVGDRAAAEDLLQEAFVRSLDRLPALERAESAVAWFYRVLRNAAIDHHRRNASRGRALSAFAAELSREAGPLEETRGAICACVSRLAGTLKPEYAEALRRVELDGVAVKDFAAESGITATNAGVRVFRAREALRRQVARSCGTCAEHGCLDCSCPSAGVPPGADFGTLARGPLGPEGEEKR